MRGSSCELAARYRDAMMLTYSYRLVPNRKQHGALECILESQRALYNAALQERIAAYSRGITLTYFDQAKELTEWRQSDEEAAKIPSRLQRATLKRLDEAYKAFFRRVKQKAANPGFPRFRGKGWWDSFGFHEFVGISFDGRSLRFKGMPGALRVHLHRAMPESAPIRSCIFKRDTKGWKIGFTVQVPSANQREGDRNVGIDLGISIFAALSDGGFIPSLRAARRAQRELRTAQRSLSRKRLGSKRRQKARAQLARCHAKTARVRSNYLHEASARLVRDYDVVAVEALNVQGLARGFLARDVNDAGWRKFLSMLRYKAERAGVRIIKVNARYSSQECSACGAIVQKELNERWHRCAQCGLSIARDLNAARNILGRAGVGPCLLNVADDRKRAGGNLV